MHTRHWPCAGEATSRSSVVQESVPSRLFVHRCVRGRDGGCAARALLPNWPWRHMLRWSCRPSRAGPRLRRSELVGDLRKHDRKLVADDRDVVRSQVFPGLWIDSAAVLARHHARAVRTLRKGLTSPEHTAFLLRLRMRDLETVDPWPGERPAGFVTRE